jgi:hypothetical protein
MIKKAIYAVLLLPLGMALVFLWCVGAILWLAIKLGIERDPDAHILSNRKSNESRRSRFPIV